MNIEQLGDIIDRYLAGTATDPEKAWVEQWLQQRPEDHLSLTPETQTAVHDRLWQSFAARAGWQSARPARIFHFSRKWLAYAAAVAILIACALWLRPPTNHQPVAQTISAQPGSHKKVTLPDSSVAHLFPGATLTIPDDYNAKDRRIALTGRIFFEVKADASRPFLVTSGKMVTKVLGTSFEMMAPDSLHAAVTVRTGKVGVHFDGRPLAELTPGKRLRFHVQRQDFTIDDVNAAMLCEWWNNGMVFHQAPLEEVVQALTGWYNIPISITNVKWKTEPVTIRIRNLSATEAVSLLSQTLGFRYKKDRNNIIIY